MYSVFYTVGGWVEQATVSLKIYERKEGTFIIWERLKIFFFLLFWPHPSPPTTWRVGSSLSPLNTREERLRERLG